MWKLLRIKDIKIDKDGKVRNVQVETPTGKLLDRPINVLYPLEVNDEEIHLEPNKKENMKFPETEQNTEELQEPIAMRTRSNTKRQSRLKEDQTTITAPSSETCFTTGAWSLCLKDKTKRSQGWFRPIIVSGYFIAYVRTVLELGISLHTLRLVDELKMSRYMMVEIISSHVLYKDEFLKYLSLASNIKVVRILLPCHWTERVERCAFGCFLNADFACFMKCGWASLFHYIPHASLVFL
ncbi:Uncharacterized protein BM_BM3070 [Brugia malayi]|uniref:DUF5641 domain-containing protein n=1 Tax=Brugia malayi TaxID=6279 RepID=A0A4E9FCU9_BRUMA|nr:Uncharacterized protein BM_BM3070 [Brugia malayi]VIO94617.1 Uncharacterized protein BM_BM3070 [Brugia malayi]